MSANGDRLDQSCSKDGDKWLANKTYFVDRTYKTSGLGFECEGKIILKEFLGF